MQKPEVYSQSLDILEGKRRKYIQTCGRNQDGYLKAWDKIGKTIADWRKKKGEETKKNIQRWRQNKHRSDQAKAHVS